MHRIVSENRERIAELCRLYDVRRLSVFESAVRSDFDAARSEVDLIHEAKIRNPYLLREIRADQETLYAA